MRRSSLWLAWTSFAGIAVIWLATCVLGDRLWWTLPFLYGPRWLAALLLVGMIPALTSAPRRGWLPALLGTLLIIFGLLGFRLGLGRRSAGGRQTIRVMELNADGGHGDVAAILRSIDQIHPDVVVIAECGAPLRDALDHLPGFHSKPATSHLCFLSRGKILEWSEGDTTGRWNASDPGAIAKAVVATLVGPIQVGLVHLETPRSALQDYLDLSEILKQAPPSRANIAQREAESRLAAAWLNRESTLPIIVAGDFNLPVESAIYRRYWGNLSNAFSRAGLGTGYTKYTRLWGSRIDHILSDQRLTPIRSYVGDDVGSDHRPLVADFLLQSPER